MKRRFLWVCLLAASGLQPGCISKGDTNIGRDEEESSSDDDDDDDDDDESPAGRDGPDADTNEDDDVAAPDADDDLPMMEPEPDAAEPEPEPEPQPEADVPSGSGGSGAGTGGTPAEPSGGGTAGTPGAAGDATGGSGGTDEPDVVPMACDGTAKTPVNNLSLSSLPIADPNAMSGLGVDFDGEKFIVAWISGTDAVRFAAVDLDGSVDGPWDLPRGATETLSTTDVRVVTSSRHPGLHDTLIAWQDIGGLDENRLELYGNWVASDGARELTEAFAILLGANPSMNPRFDAAWLDVDGGTYGFGFAGSVVQLSEEGDSLRFDGGFNQFVAMTPRAGDFVSLTSNGGDVRRLGRTDSDPSPSIVSIADSLTTAAGGCGDFRDPSSCSTRIAWSGPNSNEVWVVSGATARLERFAVDGSPIGTPSSLGVATSRVLDARYHPASDTVGVLFSQNSSSESVRVALRRGDATVVADAGSLGSGNETHSGQLVWAGDDLYAFWLTRPQGGGARGIYSTRVLCR